MPNAITPQASPMARTASAIPGPGPPELVGTVVAVTAVAGATEGSFAAADGIGLAGGSTEAAGDGDAAGVGGGVGAWVGRGLAAGTDGAVEVAFAWIGWIET
jgi:hypothetical protein